ncbi:hypothetical protein RFI_18212, partial [Reticulomyxa filosa]
TVCPKKAEYIIKPNLTMKSKFVPSPRFVKPNPRKCPSSCFADNYVSKYKLDKQGTLRQGYFLFFFKKKKKKIYIHIFGQYDDTFGHGITTRYNKRKISDIMEVPHYVELLRKEFEPLIAHLRQGGDVVIPYLSAQQLRSDEAKALYWHPTSNKQTVFHSLDATPDHLPFYYLSVIQMSIDNLANYAQSEQVIGIYDHNIFGPQSDESILNLSSIPNITKPVDVDLDGSLLLPTGELHGDTLVDEKHQGDTFTLPDFVSRNALENTRNAFLSNVSLNNAIHAWNALVDGAGAASNRLSVAWIGCIPFFIFFILFVDLLNNDWLLKNDHIAWGLVACFLGLLWLVFDPKH